MPLACRTRPLAPAVWVEPTSTCVVTVTAGGFEVGTLTVRAVDSGILTVLVMTLGEAPGLEIGGAEGSIKMDVSYLPERLKFSSQEG